MLSTTATRILVATLSVAGVLLTGLSADAQDTPANPLKVFASSADIAGLIARAKKERTPDQANIVLPAVRVPPYTISLEYRMSGLTAPVAVHMKEAEVFWVVEGTGKLTTGGTLIGEALLNPDNKRGTGIAGGQTRQLAAGDVLIVPENTPHWFEPSNGALVLLSLHVPRPR